MVFVDSRDSAEIYEISYIFIARLKSSRLRRIGISAIIVITNIKFISFFLLFFRPTPSIGIIVFNWLAFHAEVPFVQVSLAAASASGVKSNSFLPIFIVFLRAVAVVVIRLDTA